MGIRSLVHERLIPHQLECVDRMLAFHEVARAVTRTGRSCHTLEHWAGERSAVLVWQSPRYNKYGRPLLDKLRPDAYGVYSIGTKMGDFWLEVDRGKQRFRSSEWLDHGPYSFATKVRAYFDYVTRLGWLDCRAPIPALLVVTNNKYRAAELRRVFAEVAAENRFRHLPLPIFVTTAEWFRSQGPLAPIWQAVRTDDLTYCFVTLREEAGGP